MSEFTQGILVALVPSMIVSIFTAYVTVRLSMRQFYSQRWWEKRAEAYSQIIEHLTFLQFYYGEWISEEMDGKVVSDADKERFLEIISGIATEKKIPLHYFHERYKNAPIFSNGSHVAFHERGLIYSDDMIKVIKQELGL